MAKVSWRSGMSVGKVLKSVLVYEECIQTGRVFGIEENPS